jgi:hypothetical protein
MAVIGPIPTPNPPSGVSYTPQLTGGQIYDDKKEPDWNVWNQGWNEGYNNPTASYGGQDQNYGSGYLAGQQEYAKRTSSKPGVPVADNSNYQPPVITVPDTSYSVNSPQFDWNVYRERGWTDQKAAEEDFKKTGGPQPSGGGSGVDPMGAFLQQNPNSDIGKYGMDPGEFTRLIDENYSAGMSMISQLEGNAASIRDADLADVAGAEATGKQLIQSQQAEGQQILDTGKKESYDRKEDVISAARRLYNEAQQGTRQKFGGMTSAGGAVKELLSREFFSNVGDAKKSYSAAMDEIRNQAMTLARTIADKTQELFENVKTWKNEAVRNFQSNMANIAQQKYALESDRNQAKLGLLEKFRNESMQIAAAEKQFQQQLQLMKEQAGTQISQQTSSVNSALENLIKNTNTNPQTQFKLPGTSGTATSALTGRIGRDDEMTGVVTPISKYNPSSQEYWMR